MTITAIQALIDRTSEPRIEIGGPTPEGYTFLTGLGLHLPDHIIVSNLANPVTLNPFGDDPQQFSVDQVLDIRSFPYDANSIGMLMTYNLPVYGDHAHESKQVALAEYDTPAASSKNITDLHNLHIVLLREAYRTLLSGGLLVVGNVRPQDTPFAQKLGFKPLLAGSLEQRVYGQLYLRP